MKIRRIFTLFLFVFFVLINFSFSTIAAENKKTYWDDPKLREEYKKFWNEYQRISKLENIDYSEYTRQKESLFIYYDLKLLNRTNNHKYEAVKEFYRIKLRELKGLRKLKNSYKTLDGKRMLKK